GLDAGGQAWATAFNVVISGKDFKKNIEEAKMDSRKLRDLVPSLFHFTHEDDKSDKNLGFIAENLQKVIPASTSVQKCSGIPSLNLVPIMSATLAYAKDLEARVSSLEDIIKSLVKPELKSV